MSTPSHAAPKASRPWPTTPKDLQERIRRRAEEIYVGSGRIPGRDVQNWMQAEQEMLGKTAHPSAHRTAIVVNVAGIQYVGEYNEASAAGYVPGEFGPSDPIPVRFEGDKMFVKRPNGKELETRIVQRVG